MDRLKLTAKQREVFDLLLVQQTTKEIARALKISPSAVDQRIIAARRAMGNVSRREATFIYACNLEAEAKPGGGTPSVLATRLSRRKVTATQPKPANVSIQKPILWTVFTIGGIIIALQLCCVLKHGTVRATAPTGG